MSAYQKMIRELLAKSGRIGTDPAHVESFMRIEHDTLDALSPREFAREVEIAAECVAASSALDCAKLAWSFGLGPKPEMAQ